MRSRNNEKKEENSIKRIKKKDGYTQNRLP